MTREHTQDFNLESDSILLEKLGHARKVVDVFSLRTDSEIHPSVTSEVVAKPDNVHQNDKNFFKKITLKSPRIPAKLIKNL